MTWTPRGLTVDSESIIWAEIDSIKRVPIAGGDITILANGIDTPSSLIVDASNIYWNESLVDGVIGGYGGKIARVSIAGGPVTTMISGIMSAFPKFSVDDTNIYIIDKWTIKKVSVDGGPVEKLVAGGFYLQDLITDGAFVYWIENPFSTVCRIPVNGGEVETLAPNTGTSGPPGPIRLDNTYVYWMDHYDMINKVPKTGGPTVTIASGLSFLSDFVVDGTYVYFSENDTGKINKVSVDGGLITTLVYGSQYFSPYILAVDNFNIYWVNQDHVGKVPKDGGTQTIIQGNLITDPYIANTIAVDDINIYWTESGGGTIKRMFYLRPIGPMVDFDSNRKTDAFWRHATSGQTVIWLMDGASYSSDSSGTVSDFNWQIKGMGDFNGNGKTDILWQDTSTGWTSICFMDGATISSQQAIAQVGSTWQIKKIGDFDGDGKADVLWQDSSTGWTYIWFMDGETISSGGAPAKVGLNWQIKEVGDFNGDGKADILWQNTSTGWTYIWFMDGGNISSTGVPAQLSDSNWQIMN